VPALNYESRILATRVSSALVHTRRRRYCTIRSSSKQVFVRSTETVKALVLDVEATVDPEQPGLDATDTTVHLLMAQQNCSHLSCHLSNVTSAYVQSKFSLQTNAAWFATRTSCPPRFTDLRQGIFPMMHRPCPARLVRVHLREGVCNQRTSFRRTLSKEDP